MSTTLPAASRTCPVAHASPRELTARLRAATIESFEPRLLPAPRMPAALQTLSWLFRPELALLEAYAQRYGDAFRLDPLLPRCRSDATRWPLVRVPTIVLAAPDDIRAVFSQSGDVLTGGDAREFLEWYYGPECIIALDDAAHLRERRLLQTVFDKEFAAHAPARIDAAVSDCVRELPSSGQAPLATLLEELNARAYTALLFGALPEASIQRVHRFLHFSLDSIGWRALPMAFPALRHDFGRWSPGGRQAALFADFRALIAAEIRLRRGAPPSADVLGTLLRLRPADTPQEIESQFMRVVGIIGGTDLIFGALVWCAYHLLQHPDALARATDEARCGDSLTGGFLEAACKEALRLNPPFPVAVRRVRKPVSIRGLQLAPGAHIAVSIHLAHRRAEVYPDPGSFRPERFLEREFSPFEYLPFGGGARRCLGYPFATGQVATILAALLREFDIRAASPISDRVRRRSIMFIPRDPLLAELRRVSRARSAAHAQ